MFAVRPPAQPMGAPAAPLRTGATTGHLAVIPAPPPEGATQALPRDAASGIGALRAALRPEDAPSTPAAPRRTVSATRVARGADVGLTVPGVVVLVGLAGVVGGFLDVAISRRLGWLTTLIFGGAVLVSAGRVRIRSRWAPVVVAPLAFLAVIVLLGRLLMPATARGHALLDFATLVFTQLALAAPLLLGSTVLAAVIAWRRAVAAGLSSGRPLDRELPGMVPIATQAENTGAPGDSAATPDWAASEAATPNRATDSRAALPWQRRLAVAMGLGAAPTLAANANADAPGSDIPPPAAPSEQELPAAVANPEKADPEKAGPEKAGPEKARLKTDPRQA